jgi:methionine-rich copper-binding protein CopC
MTLNRWLIPTVTAVLWLAGAQLALPHASLIRASPPANSAVQTAPREVSLLFSERVRAAPGAIAVRDAKGARVDKGDIRLDTNGRIVRTSLQPLGPGSYRVNWRVRSNDGHTVQGSFTFRVRQ